MRAVTAKCAAVAAAAACVWAEPAAAQTRPAKVPLAALTVQGFEVKAVTGNQAGVPQTLVLQKGEQVFLCSATDLSIEPQAFACWSVK